MPVFETRRRVAVPAELAFEIAADVGSYSEFLPLMESSKIVGDRRPTIVGEQFKAELAVAYAKLGLSGRFVSNVETNAKVLRVVAKSTDGPFRHVETEWCVVPAATGSDVLVRIDYAFRNPLMQLAAAGIMETAIAKVMSAFEARALRLLAERNALKQV